MISTNHCGVSSEHIEKIFWVAAYVLVVALLLASARGDLWFDEIWSLSFVQSATSWWDVFTRLHHDNNHPLNSLFLYFFGLHQPFWVYRLPAVLAGIGSILLLGKIARRWGSFEEAAVVLVAGMAYPFLLYGSEARGYMPAIWWGLLSYVIREAWHRKRHWGRLLLLWMTMILGTLSHFTFIILLLSLFFLGVWEEFMAPATRLRKIRRLTVCWFPPFLFFAWFYWFFSRDMIIGGGPVVNKGDVLCRMAAILAGTPEIDGIPVLTFIGIILVIVAGILVMYREGERWLFYCCVLLVVPALFLLLVRSDYFYFRYLTLCFPFFYLLVAYLLGKCYRLLSGGGKWVPVIFIVLLIAGHFTRVGPLLVHGRGNYRSAVNYLAENSSQNPITIGSDHDFRNRLLLFFYARRLSCRHQFRYIPQENLRREPPEWFIAHTQDARRVPPRKIAVPGGRAYQIEGVYRSCPVSGWNWFLYRRIV